jgi:hypothetical protein
VVDCAAAALSIPREKVLKEAKLALLSGPSLKATLDINWDDPGEQAAALQRLLGEVAALQAWLSARAGATSWPSVAPIWSRVPWCCRPTSPSTTPSSRCSSAFSSTGPWPTSTSTAATSAARTAAALGVGRSVTIHPQEELLLKLRRERRTPRGRALLRERVEIEHQLARVGGIQGPRARYKGARKNTLDLRRCAAVANLQTLARAA